MIFESVIISQLPIICLILFDRSPKVCYGFDLGHSNLIDVKKRLDRTFPSHLLSESSSEPWSFYASHHITLASKGTGHRGPKFHMNNHVSPPRSTSVWGRNPSSFNGKTPSALAAPSWGRCGTWFFQFLGSYYRLASPEMKRGRESPVKSRTWNRLRYSY
jgi:hypothetical protein